MSDFDEIDRPGLTPELAEVADLLQESVGAAPPLDQDPVAKMLGITPSYLLSAAADLIRDTAAAATPGPWFAHDTWLDNGGFTATVLSGEPGTGGFDRLRAWLPSMSQEPWDKTRNVWNDAQWIALVSPAVAGPVEAILREASASAAHHVPIWQNSSVDGHDAPKRTAAEVDELVEHHYGHALALARAVLGEENNDG